MPYFPTQAQAFLDADGLRKYTEEEFRRLSQVLATDTAAGAPSDGNIYGMQDGVWTEIPSSTTDVESYLLEIPAWKHGVPGDGSNQTAALQAIIDSIPAVGGTNVYTGVKIHLRGTILIDSLNLNGKCNIVFEGRGNTQGPNYGLTTIQTNAGAIGTTATIINSYGSVNISWEGITFYAPNAAFNGIFMCPGHSGGAPVLDTPHFYMKRCGIGVVSDAGIGLWLHGATLVRLDDVAFSCRVQLQYNAGVLHCNAVRFFGCTFNPTGNYYPIQGIGDATTFINCTFEPCPDGIGRAYNGAALRMGRALSFIGCYFLDNTVAGEWINAQWIHGFTMSGCYASGPGYILALGGGVDSGDPQINGVRGFTVTGNCFEYVSAVFGFYGDPAPGVLTNARGGFVAGNSITNGAMFANIALCGSMVVLPNSVYGAMVYGHGVGVSLLGLQAYANRTAAVAAGLTTGELYRCTTAGPADNYAICMV